MLGLVWAFPHGPPYCFRLCSRDNETQIQAFFPLFFFSPQGLLRLVSVENINSTRKESFFLSLHHNNDEGLRDYSRRGVAGKFVT